MKLLSSLKKGEKNEKKSNLTLLAFAFICAIAGWFIIAMRLYPSASKEVTNIRLQTDISGTSAAENGLKVIKCSTDSVKVSFDCSRTDYNQLNPETIRAYIDFENITTSGKKVLNVKVESINGADMSNLVISPPTVTVELDKFETKSFVLSSKTPNVTAVEGTVIDSDNIICEPAEINITGPAAQLASISEVYAVSDKVLTLDSTYNLNSDRFQLLGEDGSKIDPSMMSFDNPVISMKIPVLTQRTVNLGVQLIGVPPNFDIGCINYTITPPTITIAAESTEVNLPDPLQIKISLSSLDIGYSVDTELDKLLTANNIKNISGIEKVNVSLNSEGLSSKEIWLNGSDISLINKPSGDSDYSILTQQLKVKVVGPADIINDLTAKDLDAEVNLLGADTSKDQFPYSVTISCKTNNNIWSVNDTKIIVQKTLKEGVTTQPRTSNQTTTTS